MGKIPYIDYKILDGFYTVQQVAGMLRLGVRELAEKASSIISVYIGMMQAAICSTARQSRNCTTDSITKAEAGGVFDDHE